MAKDKRNMWIIGHPNSEATEVFNAILRFDQTPPVDYTGAAVCDSDTVDWGEYGDTEKPPYDAKKRTKIEALQKKRG